MTKPSFILDILSVPVPGIILIWTALFVVPASAQQAPVLGLLSPAALGAGNTGVQLAIDGSGFATGAAVRWTFNGVVTNLSGVNVVNATRVTAPLPASLLAAAGKAQVVVANTAGPPSDPLNFTITTVPYITGATNDALAAGSPPISLGLFGFGFAPGATVRLTGSYRNGFLFGPNVVSATQMNATLTMNLTDLPDLVQVVVVNPNGDVSNPWLINVYADTGADVTSITPATLHAGNPATTLTLDGTYFPPNPRVRWTANHVTTFLSDVRVVSPTRITAALPADLLAAPGAADVSVWTPSTWASRRFEFTIDPPSPIPATVTVSRPSGPSDQPTVTITVPAAQSNPLQGILTLSFTPDPSIQGLPTGYLDPAVKFAGSSNQTLSFTVPANATTAALPSNGQFTQGTVAGTFTLTVSALTSAGLSVLPTRPPSATLQQAPAAPVITPGSVKIVNVTAAGFGIEVQGYTNTRSLTSANLTFTAAAGTQLNGSTVNVPIGTAALAPWFDSAAGRQSGGGFLMTIPFTYSGDTSALSSVSVTLTNSAGTSTAVSGTR